MPRPLLVLSAILFLAWGRSAAVEPDADRLQAWQRLCADQLGRLVAFAKAGGGKAGSLDLELREQAAALARKLDPKTDQLRNLFAQKHAMSAEDKEADQRLRAAVAEREKSRPDGDAPPRPETLAEEFEALRFRIIAEQADFAARLSLDPDEPAVVAVRALAIKRAQELLGSPKRTYEKRLKERLARLAAAAYEPWTGTWTCDAWGAFAMTQKAGKATAALTGGALAGEVKGRSLVGTWSAKGRRGTFVFTLGADDQGFDARLTVEMTDPESWSAMRKAEDAPAPAATDAQPAEPPAADAPATEPAK
jgi:hypothetical protein